MEWKTQSSLVAYEEAHAFMEARVEQIAACQAEECIWMVEHPPLYTAGTSAKAEDLLYPQFPVFHTGRGGQYTYHGPGQLVVYVMLNLKARYSPHVPDIRHFVQTLEQWMIDALTVYDVIGERREGRVGIWVARKDGSRLDDKVAALGIRIRRGVSFHGMAINIAPDLTHYQGIVPCGITAHGVTSLAKLNKDDCFDTMRNALKKFSPF